MPTPTREQDLEDFEYLQTFYGLVRDALCRLLFAGWDRERYRDILKGLGDWVCAELGRTAEK